MGLEQRISHNNNETNNYNSDNKQNMINEYKIDNDNKNKMIKNLQEQNKILLIEKDTSKTEYNKQIDELKQKLNINTNEINKLIIDNKNSRNINPYNVYNKFEIKDKENDQFVSNK